MVQQSVRNHHAKVDYFFRKSRSREDQLKKDPTVKAGKRVFRKNLKEIG